MKFNPLTPAWGVLLCVSCAPEEATIGLEAGTRFQTIVGWEAHHQAGAEEPRFAELRDSLFSLAVEGIGINRIRIEAWSGIEQPHDWYEEFRAGRIDMQRWRCHRWMTVNDNDDPAVINWSGFQFHQLDEAIETVVLPMKDRLEARGERLYVNLTYDSFVHQCPGVEYIHDDITEYAEFALATFLHVQEKYGFVPDAWEVILEPDNSDWKGPAIGQAMVATGDLLSEHGFTPEFIAPSSANTGRAIRDFDEMIEVPRVEEYLTEFSYHRYGGVTDARLRQIAERGNRYGIRTSMLEHMGSGHESLHADLTLANVSAWQQFALAYRTDDNGAQYIVIDDSGVSMGDRTRYLQQYFRFIREGAVRIAAVSSSVRVAPVAFVDPDGGTVVVVKTDGRAALRVEDLPAGVYGVTYTTPSETAVDAGDVTVGSDGVLSADMPGRGVITIHAR